LNERTVQCGDGLRRVVADDLAKPLPKFIDDMGAHLAKRHGVVAVLFYGNILRDAKAAGLLDFYVLTESDRAYHGRGLSALANRLLPPNVYHEVFEDRHAKVAVMSVASFAHRMRRESWDTTLWTRFSQSTRLVYADDLNRALVIDAIVTGWRTAAFWADALTANESDVGASRWTTLFTQTYGVELRPEGGSNRASRIVETSADLFALIDAELPMSNPSPDAIRGILHGWRWRRAAGKPLNILRLFKAVFTFRGGAEYAMSKLDKHTDGESFLKPWERRHPWLAAPGVLLRLVRRNRNS